VKAFHIDRTLQSAISEFNKYRNPEIIAKLCKFEGEFFKIDRSKGTFCYTCGFYDYFDEFDRSKYLLDNFGLKSDIKEIIEMNEKVLVNFELTNARERSN